MKCNIHGKFFGYYFGLGAFLSQHPLGMPGSCFLNGETLSLWVWDEINRRWVDSNRVDNWLSGVVDDAETFVPEVKDGIKTAYLYPTNQSGTVTFTHFTNQEVPLSIEISGTSMVTLYWNGTYWEYMVTPMSLAEYAALESYAKKDLSNVDMTAYAQSDLSNVSQGDFDEKAYSWWATGIDESNFLNKGVLPTSMWECTLDDDTETATPGVRSFTKMSMAELFDAANRQRHLLVKSTGITTLVSGASCSFVESPGSGTFVSARVIFLGADGYMYDVRFSEEGEILAQSYWSHSEFAKKSELNECAAKDLSNVALSAFRNKNIYPVSSFVYSVDGDHAVTPANAGALVQILSSLSGAPGSLLYAEGIASAGGDVGLSPVSFALMAEDPIDYSLTFVGNDGYLHVLRVNGLGAISQQYAYRIDDLATKSFISSSGYRPMRVIDLGSYRDGVFSLDGTPYWGDMQTTLYSYLDGGCGVLLRASTQFDEPRVFAPTRIYQDGGTLYVIEFMVSATQLCEIRIDEDADIESGESLFSQQFTAIGSGGSGGSGTVTTGAFSDINDYNEVK